MNALTWKRHKPTRPYWNFCLFAFIGGEPVLECVKYSDGWYMFFRPAGWKNFGNAVMKTPRGSVHKVDTLRAAVAICQTHFDTFGARPASSCSLIFQQ
jgi:hypothetical protein